MTTGTNTANTMPARPALYLVYLVFLYVPWLFYAPGPVDIFVAVAATLAYLPLHFAGFRTEGRYRLLFIAAIAILGVLTAPFANGNSVFHIYAAALTGYLRPVRKSGLVLGLCMAVYVASALYFDRFILEIVVALIISIVVWVSTFADSEANAAHDRAERERTLEAQQASLVERERIARDLHDLLGHTLTLVSLKADLAGRLIDTDIERARAEIASIQTASRQALGDVRATLSGLTATTVQQELQNGQAALDAAAIKLTITGTFPDLSSDRDTAMGLMIREAVTNIVRHSSATEARISFHRQDGHFSITISDNGAPDGVVEGNGLAGLRARLEALGGILSVDDADGLILHAALPA